MRVRDVGDKDIYIYIYLNCSIWDELGAEVLGGRLKVEAFTIQGFGLRALKKLSHDFFASRCNMNLGFRTLSSKSQ